MSSPTRSTHRWSTRATTSPPPPSRTPPPETPSPSPPLRRGGTPRGSSARRSSAPPTKILGRLSNVVTGEPSTIGIEAATAAYLDGVPWLEEEVAHLAANWEHLRTRLPEVLPGIVLPQQEATFLAWLDVSQVERLRGADGTVTAPAERLRTHARVAFNEGTDFGPVGAGHIRLNFGTSREILDEALDRIAAADLHTGEDL